MSRPRSVTIQHLQKSLLYSPKHCRRIMVSRSTTCLAAETLPLLDNVPLIEAGHQRRPRDNWGDAP